jgi:hypothetical protein
MHDKKVYDPESKDNKLILLVDQLRNGLDLEGLEYYNIIEARVLDRINIHARDLYSKGFIVSSDGASGQYRQAEEFRKCWENKEKYWGDHASASGEVQEPETPRPKTPATSTTIDPSGDADDRLFVGPEPTPPPAANPMANKAFRTVCTFIHRHLARMLTFTTRSLLLLPSRIKEQGTISKTT